MCTTYTWLAYLPERARRQAAPQQQQQQLRGAPPMTCIREEDEVADEEVVVARRPRRRRTRHWVGLAIVGVQMAAWCLVGALLMHRGVSNLKRRDAALLRAASAATTPTPSASSTLQWTLRAEKEDDADDDAGFVTTTQSMEEEDEDAEDDLPHPSVRDGMWKWSSFVPVRPPPGLVAPRDDVILPAPPQGSGPSSSPRVPETGAATAVVMVTVGGVMLVVGPAFMMIKIMDVYQRQKRLSKLSEQEDPPPSYDEVAEKAPRYSALFQVLENGELAALPLMVGTTAAAHPGAPGTPAGASESPAGVAGAPRRHPGAETCTTTTAPAEGGGCVEQEEEEEEQEPDASTPLRQKEAPNPPSASEDKSRRSSV